MGIVKLVATKRAGKELGRIAWTVGILIFGFVFAFIASVGGVIGIVAVAAGSQQENSTSTCSASMEDLSELVIPGENADGQWTLSEEEKAVAIGLYQGAVEVNATDEEIQLVLAAAMQESRLAVYANEIVPESMKLPHDQVGTPRTADGRPVDAIGPLQQRPSANWGTADQLMTPRTAAQAFLGGKDGPRGGASPAGLRDQGDLGGLSFAEKIESVQVSGEPEHYAKWENYALTLRKQLREGLVMSCAGAGSGSGTLKYPIADWAHVTVTDGVGPRDNSEHGASSWHPALDLVMTNGGSCGVPVLSMQDGEVVLTGAAANGVWVRAADGTEIGYLHMEVVNVAEDDAVTAGQQLGEIGSAPPSTGCHLDLRVDAANSTGPVAKLPKLTSASVCPTCVDPDEFARVYGMELTGTMGK